MLVEVSVHCPLAQGLGELGGLLRQRLHDAMQCLSALHAADAVLDVQGCRPGNATCRQIFKVGIFCPLVLSAFLQLRIVEYIYVYIYMYIYIYMNIYLRVLPSLVQLLTHGNDVVTDDVHLVVEGSQGIREVTVQLVCRKSRPISNMPGT